METKPWTASHGIWGAIGLAVVGVLQLVVAVGQSVSFACADGEPGCVWSALGSLNWGTWAITIAGLAAGIGLAVSRWRAGKDDDDDSTATLTRGRPGGGVVAPLAVLAAGAALLSVGCNPFVTQVRCPVGSPPSARILPVDLPGMEGEGGGVAVGRCGQVEVERWTCTRAARVVCEADPPYVLCIADDGHERRMSVEDPDGVLCGKEY
jgi:hypothetical protein